MTMVGRPDTSNRLPRLDAMGTDRPSKDRAAVAPRATITFPFKAFSSASSHGWQASASAVTGFLCSRRLPRVSCLKCFTSVRCVHGLVVDSSVLQALPEHCARRADERDSPLVLDVTGLLADQYQRCRSAPLPEDRLDGVDVQRAACAVA